ncbi:MAG: hypothetical protein ABUS51_09710 [Acidobacteriota bacterium]
MPWPEGAGTVAVEYSTEAFERLRLAALDGLTALPRIGMGIGGLLLGTRHNSRIRILDFIPIPCSHARGPSFSLSSEEIRHALELSPPEPLAVVGWYWSRTRGQKGLTEESAALFTALCGEPWQIMLVLRPSMAEPSRADLFFREKGLTVPGPGLEMLPAELASEDASATPDELAPPEPAAPPAAMPVLNRPTPAPPPVRPLFAMQQTAPRRHWLPWVLAGTLLCAGGGTAAWVTRNEWIPRPPLKMEATESQGRVTFRWNTDAVNGLDGAVLLINDGGELHTFPLTQARLEGGVMDYERKSRRVTGTLRIGENRAIATYFEPVSEPPPSAPAR